METDIDQSLATTTWNTASSATEVPSLDTLATGVASLNTVSTTIDTPGATSKLKQIPVSLH